MNGVGLQGGCDAVMKDYLIDEILTGVLAEPQDVKYGGEDSRDADGSRQEHKGVFADIMMDRWFKRAFGEDFNGGRLLKLLLNELIPEREIVKMTFLSTEHTSPFTDGKDTRMDLECVDGDGTRFIVEMQVRKQEFFRERMLMYGAYGLLKQHRREKVDRARPYDYPPLYVISLTDFGTHGDSSRVLFRNQLMDVESFEIMTDRFVLISLEMSNCGDEFREDWSTLEKFCYAMRHMTQYESRPEELGDELLDLLFESADISKFTEEEKFKYAQDMTTERDIMNQMDFARKEGLEEGMEKGKTETSVAIARKILSEGMSMEMITKLTGVTKEML